MSWMQQRNEISPGRKDYGPR